MTLRRVAIVSPYALSVFGGVQEQVLGLSREWSRRGVEVRLFVPDGRDDATYDTPATVSRYGSLVSIPANGSKAPLTLSPGAARAVRHDVATFAPDVVNLHEPFAPVLGWSLLGHRYPRVVGTFHRSGGGPAYSLTRPLLRQLAKGLAASVSVSSAAADTILQGAGLASTVLFNGFETERFRSFSRDVSSTPRVVFVGRLEVRKGAATVLEAVIRHNERQATPWELDVIGTGPLREGLEQRAAGSPFIRFHGAVDDATKRQLLRRASVAVAASTHGESFGLVCLEPMAAEVPVVVSDIPGYRAAVGDHATLFAPGNAESLETAIETALRASSEDVAAARAHAEQWSMAALCDRYVDVFNAVAD